MTPTHLLIGCGSRKLDHAAPARDLYTGPLFRAARGYAEASGLPWAILSARHGLVMPDAVIEPYDYRLGRLEGAPRSRYVTCRDLGRQLTIWIGRGGVATLAVHAGRPYARWAFDATGHAALWFVEVETPLAHLQIGQRLAWYRQRRTA